jgi:hypothetical protein
VSDKYIFVIDTDQYAGNFEREMCACLTGQVGQCEVGKEEKAKFRKEVGEDMYDSMDSWVEQRPDPDHGWLRPCGIYPTHGYFNNGVGTHFKVGQEEEAKKRFEEYCKEQGSKWYLDMLKRPFTTHPSYQSVAIYFHDKPSQEIIDMMKQRAYEFLKGKCRIMGDPRTMKIIGFRLIKETLSKEETHL